MINSSLLSSPLLQCRPEVMAAGGAGCTGRQPPAAAALVVHMPAGQDRHPRKRPKSVSANIAPPVPLFWLGESNFYPAALRL
eukprot:CAMPEP_0194718268 /NCGR_PEP_ID=MMETSP0296-20130528/9825_1 /TAXON_ID=39354 /ORGANISM="Heterosigma akashiwo, Strain CCMP2393" /LENGTH=81 /DNA_ID=CAMNT_0039619467 /DNA_START=44 /DNA_END=286 /DNA_ORIENTATION=+